MQLIRICHFPFTTWSSLLIATLFSTGSLAEEAWRDWATGDRASFELSAFDLNSSAEIGVKDAFLGGITIDDLEGLLDLDDSEVVPHVNAMWRMAERHTLRYQHYSQDQDQKRDIDILDIPITTTRTELDLQMDTLGYTYSILFDENRDFYLGVGVSLFDIELKLTDSEEIFDDIELDESAPFPSLLIGYDWAINDRWVWRNSASWLALSLSTSDDFDYSGHVYSLSTAIEWRLLNYMSLTAGYEFSDFDVDAENKDDDYTITYADRIHGPRLGLKVRF